MGLSPEEDTEIHSNRLYDCSLATSVTVKAKPFAMNKITSIYQNVFIYLLLSGHFLLVEVKDTPILGSDNTPRLLTKGTLTSSLTQIQSGLR